jgi:hypothetical protein
MSVFERLEAENAKRFDGRQEEFLGKENTESVENQGIIAT